MIEQVSENNERCDTRKWLFDALSSLRGGAGQSRDVDSSQVSSCSPLLRSSHLLPALDESDGGTVFARLAFSYVLAFVDIAWSSGIAALR